MARSQVQGEKRQTGAGLSAATGLRPVVFTTAEVVPARAPEPENPAPNEARPAVLPPVDRAPDPEEAGLGCYRDPIDSSRLLSSGRVASAPCRCANRLRGSTLCDTRCAPTALATLHADNIFGTLLDPPRCLRNLLRIALCTARSSTARHSLTGTRTRTATTASRGCSAASRCSARCALRSTRLFRARNRASGLASP